jgi:hypothetical protein
MYFSMLVLVGVASLAAAVSTSFEIAVERVVQGYSPVFCAGRCSDFHFANVSVTSLHSYVDELFAPGEGRMPLWEQLYENNSALIAFQDRQGPPDLAKLQKLDVFNSVFHVLVVSSPLLDAHEWVTAWKTFAVHFGLKLDRTSTLKLRHSMGHEPRYLFVTKNTLVYRTSGAQTPEDESRSGATDFFPTQNLSVESEPRPGCVTTPLRSTWPTVVQRIFVRDATEEKVWSGCELPSPVDPCLVFAKLYVQHDMTALQSVLLQEVQYMAVSRLDLFEWLPQTLQDFMCG